MRNQALLNIGIQGKDFIEQVISGSSPVRAALMQLPTAATIAGQAGLGAGDVVTGLGEKVKGLADGAVLAASKIPAVGYAIGGVTTAVAAGAAAWLSYRSEQAEVEKRLEGFGRASGVTISGVNALAASQAGSVGMSRSSTREVASIYAGTGRVGAGALSEAVGATRDFTAFLGGDQKDAATALAEALSDVSKGAGDLAQKYGLLNAATVESVQRLEAQGSRLEAQRRLIDAVRESTSGLAAETSGWAHVTQLLSNAWDGLGAALDKTFTGGTLDDRLASAKQRLEQARSEAGSSYMAEFGSGYNLQDEQRAVDRLQKLVDARDATAKSLQQNLRSQQVGVILKSLQPELTELQTMQDRVTLLRKAITDPMEFGLSGSRLAEVESEFGRLGRLAQTMREDMEKFGTTSVAELNRAADFQARTAGYTPYGRSAAEIQNQFETNLRLRGLDPNGRSSASVEADYRARLGDVSLDLPDRYNLAQRRDEELRTAREIEGYRRARDVSLSTLNRTESLSLGPQGGAFSQMSAAVQAQILEAARTSGPQVSAAIIAAIAKGESSGNLNVGFSRSLGEDGRTSSAFGLGQITRGTAEDAIRRGFLPGGYDRTNPDTMAQGIAGVLQMKLQDAGGDLTKALEAYRGSNDPLVNRAYAATALRNAGQLGDASSLGIVRDQDANSRALSQANDNLKNVTDNYGRNAVALEANARAQDQYRQMIERGISTNEAASVAFSGLQTKIAEAGSSARYVQFARDDSFARDQLGRDRVEQQVYGAARPFVGTADYQSVIARSRETINLTDAKNTLNDSLTSIVTNFRRTGDAAKAASDAAGTLADKGIAKLIDSLTSSIFDSIGKSSGMSSFFKSIFAADGYIPGFAMGRGSVGSDGIVSGPGSETSDSILARISNREAIIQGASVRFYGAPFIKAINDRTLPRFAGGGLVGIDTTRAANGSGGSPVNNFYDQRPAGSPDADVKMQRNSSGGVDVILRTIDNGLTKRAQSGRGGFQQAVSGPWTRQG